LTIRLKNYGGRRNELGNPVSTSRRPVWFWIPNGYCSGAAVGRWVFAISEVPYIPGTVVVLCRFIGCIFLLCAVLSQEIMLARVVKACLHVIAVLTQTRAIKLGLWLDPA